MNARLLLPSDNLARTATKSLTGNTATSGHPLANVTDGDITQPMLMSSGTGFELRFDLGTAQRVDGFFVPMHNFDVAANVRVRGGAAAGAATIDLPLVVPAYFRNAPNGAVGQPEAIWCDITSVTPRTYQHWTLGVPTQATRVGIGEVLFGPTTEFVRNVKWGLHSPQENFAIVKGNRYRRWAYRYTSKVRRLEASVPATAAQSVTLRRLDDECGSLAAPFILVQDPAVNRALLIHLDAPFDIEEAFLDRDEYTIRFSEAPRGLPL